MLKTVQWNVIIIIIIIVIIIIIIDVIVVVNDDTYIGFTGPPTIHFKFIAKCDRSYITKSDKC